MLQSKTRPPFDPKSQALLAELEEKADLAFLANLEDLKEMKEMKEILSAGCGKGG